MHRLIPLSGRFLCLLGVCLLFSGAEAKAGEAESSATLPPTPTQVATTLPEAIDLLQAADRLFTDQKIGRLSARVTVFRDPANLISIKALREDRVNAPGLIPLQGRYEYWSPNRFNFYLLGLLLASSEAERGAVQGLTSPLLPLPGGALSSDFVHERFRLRVSGTEEYDLGNKESVECYVLRLNPVSYDQEFFKSLTYYISVEQPHIIRGVRANFSDGGGWTGTGWGTFHYLKDRRGRLLPFIGEGQINFQNPQRKVVLKGKWSDFKTNEEAAVNPDAILKDAPVAPLDRESTVQKL
ncbi:MAG: hypothetical protein GEEBNDBF_00412 [bacterium]|nr:hypothetical protein [bacterium]